VKVSFKQPVKLGTRVYPKGTHEIPESELSGWFFKALLKDGSAGIEESEVKEEPKAPDVQIFKAEPEEEPELSESVKDQKKKRRK
jgi:hypothetical protein